MKQIPGKWLTALFMLIGWHTHAQSILNRSISVEVSRQRLEHVLEIVSNKADFYFSYNSTMVKKDSLVSIRAVSQTVKDVLVTLFGNGYEFRESGNYIIIRRAPIRLTLVTKKMVTEDKFYIVSGYVYDEQQGTAIPQASIYEKKILAAALTNTEGYFKLRLKNSHASLVALTVSKELYEDTTISIEPRYNQQVSVTLVPVETMAGQVVVSPEDYFTARPSLAVSDTLPVTIPGGKKDSVRVENKGPGRWLLSNWQKRQSLNLKKFFTTRPFQVSFTPGLGSHGKLSAQVVNNFSLNVLGGYTAGTNGIEIGGLFNIDKKEVRYVQVAGLFNSVGGRVKGFQAAGINNLVQDSVKGFQVAGVNNLVKGKMTGLQVAGVYNHVTDSVRGMQLSGVGNFSPKRTKGLQLAGVLNFAGREMDGVQIAGVLNYTHRLKGVQFGVINIADSSDGYSIGLINIVLKGYHKLSISANDILSLQVAFKTGNAKLYSILQAGLRTGDSSRVYAFGYGLGREMALNKKKNLLLNAELSSQQLYLGSWDYLNLLNRLELNLTVRAGKYFSVSAGPAYAVYISDQQQGVPGYRHPKQLPGFGAATYSKRVSGWLGFQASVNFF